MRGMSYRPEIDGLRALAVLPVVLYHAGLSWLPGGFMGVDVFFVISGYLITKIIWNELQSEQFGLGSFYERRFRRIIPALLAVVLFVLLFSLYAALPSQLVDTSRSAIAALLSISNFHFWTQTGYFSPAVEFMPLLHTWSLAVEEQFYLFFPLMLLGARALSLSVRKLFLIALPMLFTLSLYLSYEKPAFAFYLLPARTWELALGAALALGAFPAVIHRGIATTLAALGVGMLVGAYFLGHSGMLFPGYLALLPCFGAALVIHCAADGSIVARLLSLRPLVFIGLISYSLYLWHWPVLSIARMLNAEPSLDSDHAALAVLVSVLAAVLSWRLIEQPFRSHALALRRALSYVGVASVGVLALAIHGIWKDGYPHRLSLEAAKAIAVQSDIDPLRERCRGVTGEIANAECRFGMVDSTRFVIAGDSHAAAIRPAFEELLGSNAEGQLWWLGACALLEGVKTIPRVDTETCQVFREQAMQDIRNREDIDLVILAGRWPSYLLGTVPEVGGSYRTYLVDLEHKVAPTPDSTIMLFTESLARTVDDIRATGARVLLVGTVPEPGFDVPVISALAQIHDRRGDRFISRSVVAERNRLVDEILAGIANHREGVAYIQIWDSFCDTSRCSLTFEGQPAYSDDDHISYTFAKERLSQVLTERWPGELGELVRDPISEHRDPRVAPIGATRR